MERKKEKGAGSGTKAEVRPFQTKAAEKLFAVLLNLRQTGTVKEYRDLFEKVSDVVFRSIFVNGLREDVKAELSSFEAESLSDLMDLSEVAEARCRNTKCGMMKFWGKIEGRRVVIVLSTGSSDSFIAKRVVKELRLPTTVTRERFAYVNGKMANNGGLCKDLTVKVQGAKMEIRRDFFVVDLGEGGDIVLGSDWVSELGWMLMDHGPVIQVEVAGKQITLKGDPSLAKGNEIWTIQRVI
ncbi:hypothetical protein AHAS_Ahas03G0359400 [Arachis hypogaea]|uniref:Retrotransposon gag domain-containing protein n=1 Tax=Arachis hypogaea TaxID=3818 RepID=A0A445DMI9_ARAHY|nr:hypothetical protein Ahy_A03g010523 [Arachis hypogaea]